MDSQKLAAKIGVELQSDRGLLRLRPNWVAREFLKPGRRLGLTEADLNAGKRGFICERWLASETEADNTVRPANEGLSYLDIEGEEILLRDAIAAGNSRIDELLVSAGRAAAGTTFGNTGSADPEIIKFFGPDINSEAVPYLEKQARG